jgi:hypothetical protein
MLPRRGRSETPADENTFRVLEQTLMDAVKKRDQVTMNQDLAAEYELLSSDSDGKLINKTAYIRGSADPKLLTVDGFRFDKISVQQ